MIFVIFFCLPLVSSQELRPQIIDSSPDSLVKDVAQDVELFCTVKDKYNYSIVWMKQFSTPIAADQNKLVPDNRISVRFDENANTNTITYRLKITNINSKDFGNYKCTIPLEASEEISRQISLQVRSPPVIYGNTSTLITTTVNNSTSLECYSGGYPNPEVLWTKENNGVLPNGAIEYRGSVLNITNVQKEHAGVYYCSADNNVGNSRKMFTLKVEYAPLVQTVQQRVGQALGHTAQLECRIDSSPASEITWLKDGIRINSNQYYTISQFATNDNYTSAVLKLNPVEAKLYGRYTCKAQNKLGKGDVTIEFFKTELPVCAGDCTSAARSFLTLLDVKLSLSTIILLMYWI